MIQTGEIYSNIEGNNSIAISGSSYITINYYQERELTKQEQALLQMYNNADVKTQVKIMQLMYDLEEGIL